MSDKLAEGAVRLAGHITGVRFQRGDHMLDGAGHVRFGTAREIAKGLMYFVRRPLPAGVCQNGNGFLRGIRKDLGTSEGDLAVLHFPTDAIFPEEFVDAIGKVLRAIRIGIGKCCVQHFRDVIDFEPGALG